MPSANPSKPNRAAILAPESAGFHAHKNYPGHETSRMRNEYAILDAKADS
jgi:hypothetical protein